MMHQATRRRTNSELFTAQDRHMTFINGCLDGVSAKKLYLIP